MPSRSSATNSSSTSAIADQAPPRQTQHNSPALGNPFAKVNSVEPNSPSAEAGLKVGDRVCTFGDADWLNHEKLARVARLVAGSEGVSPLFDFK